jgi:hypothetical protein
LLVCVCLTKKTRKILFMEESIEICTILNTKRHFKSHQKSQSKTTRFRCPKKKILIVLIEYHKIYLNFIKVLIQYHKFFFLSNSHYKFHALSGLVGNLDHLLFVSNSLSKFLCFSLIIPNRLVG